MATTNGDAKRRSSGRRMLRSTPTPPCTVAALADLAFLSVHLASVLSYAVAAVLPPGLRSHSGDLARSLNAPQQLPTALRRWRQRHAAACHDWRCGTGPDTGTGSASRLPLALSPAAPAAGLLAALSWPEAQLLQRCPLHATICRGSSMAETALSGSLRLPLLRRRLLCLFVLLPFAVTQRCSAVQKQ